MAQSEDQLILCGGGVIGLAIAWQAARCGWSVRILEQRQVGKGASWSGAGILPPGATCGVYDPIEQLRALSHPLMGDWCHKLHADTGIDVGFRRCGGVYLARTNGEYATLAAHETWWTEHGIEYARWTLDELVERIPPLEPVATVGDVKASWYLKDECQIRNPRYLKALSTACQKLGVAIHEDEPMQEFEDDGSSILVKTVSNQYRTARLCITAGAWTEPILAESHLHRRDANAKSDRQTGIFPVRGQMVLFRAESQFFEPIINDGHRYLVPRDDGCVLAGSCEEEVGFDERTTPEMIDQLTTWARQLIPSLKQKPVERTWSGLRPGSIDGLPYLGKLPGHENIFVAAGHYRHGIHLSPITAESMVALMAGEKPPIDLAPFRLTRGKTYR